MELPWLDGVQRPCTPKRTPSVLTVAVLARLLYGTGMRLMEGLRLRVKDLDFDRGVVVVRQAKGDKDRVVMLLHSLAAELHQQVFAACALWEQDRQAHSAMAWTCRMHWKQNSPVWDNVGDGFGSTPLHPCRWPSAWAQRIPYQVPRNIPANRDAHDGK